MRGVEQIPLVYDALMAVTDRIGLWKLRAWVTAGASGHILEVGCGTGRNLPRYPRGVRVAGIDPSLEALRRGRPRPPHPSLALASAGAPPFRGARVYHAACSPRVCRRPYPPAPRAAAPRV